MLRAGVECTGSHGAGLARYLAAQQVAVVEVNQPDRSTRRRRGKTDAVDAEAAARAALSGIARALPKSGDGQVEALRMLRLAKNSAVKARTQALNQLRDLITTAPTSCAPNYAVCAADNASRSAPRSAPATATTWWPSPS